MTQKTKGIIAVSVVALIAVSAYFLLKKKDPAVQDKIHEILSLGGIKVIDATTLNKMNTFEVGYLDAWLQGLKNKAQTFVYNGKTYLTTGGKAAK